MSSSMEWNGNQQLESFPSLVAQSLRVNNAEGVNCSGSLTIFDSAFKKARQFKWQASYVGGGRWDIRGKENGVVGCDGFDHSDKVNSQVKFFVRDRLNDMRTRGAILGAKAKVVEKEDSGKPTPPPPLPPAPQPPLPPLLTTPPAKADGALPGASPIAPAMTVVRIPVNRIRRNKEQPRKRFRKAGLISLSDSMKVKGQKQLIEVIQIFGDPNADYELVTGERRLRAAQLGGMSHLNAIVKSSQEIPDKKAQRRHCATADYHREGYSKLEIALELMAEKREGDTVEEMRHTFGRSTAWVYQHLILNDLIPELQKLLDPDLPRSKQLSFPIACRIARAPKDKQMAIHLKVLAVKGSALKLIEVNRLLDELMPNRMPGRIRGPADYVKKLELIIPRTLGDALKANGYSDKVFDSLVLNDKAGTTQAMLGQLVTAIDNLTSLKGKIQDALKLRAKKRA